MSIAKQVAKQLNDVYFGGNWTVSNLKETLSDITWKQATTKVYDFNTIAVLTFHMTYYIDALIKVLEGGPLEAKDAYSFNLPPIVGQEDWNNILNKAWADAKKAVLLIENLSDERFSDLFADEKYGTVYRNIAGMTEHLHYHLGQIVLIKKILAQQGVE